MGKPIPSIFYSFNTEQPFDTCIECERKLDSDCEYVIEKSFKSYPGFNAKDVVFDYAICMECAMSLRNSFSLESRRNIDQYFMLNMPKVDAGSATDLGLERCLIKGIPVSELQEYQIYAHCKGNFLSGQVDPYLVSGLAQEELMNLISNATNDILNGFFDRHFSPDPELMKPILV